MKVRKMLVFLTVVASSLLSAAVAFAEEAAATGGSGDDGSSMKYLAAAFAIGLAAFGGALGQARAASSALEGIARNPNAASKISTPMILGLALIESLVIYALIIALLIVMS
jgi:F-type H+-transporting ATPase subunit c